MQTLKDLSKKREISIKKDRIKKIRIIDIEEHLLKIEDERKLTFEQKNILSSIRAEANQNLNKKVKEIFSKQKKEEDHSLFMKNLSFLCERFEEERADLIVELKCRKEVDEETRRIIIFILKMSQKLKLTKNNDISLRKLIELSKNIKGRQSLYQKIKNGEKI